MPWFSDKPTFPRTAIQLRPWLRDTVIGRQLFQELVKEFLEEKCGECQFIYAHPKVLVVVRRLGPLPGVEVFWEKGVTVRIEELVDTHDDRVIEVLAEDVIELQLPKRWRHMLHVPSYRSESQCFHSQTAGQRLKVLGDLEDLRILREFRDSLKP